MKLKKATKQEEKAIKLNAFVITKKEGLTLEGGPETSRGTVTTPANGGQ